MGMLPITVRKRTINKADLELIQTTVREYWDKGRTQISEILCRKWNWLQPNGRLKDMACREVLLTLKRKGLITLPPRFNSANNDKRNRAIPIVETDPLCKNAKKKYPEYPVDPVKKFVRRVLSALYN